MPDEITSKPQSEEQFPTIVRREIESLFSRLFGRGAVEPSFSAGFSPAVDLCETAEEFTIKAEIPGIDAKDLEVNLVNDVLTIKGEKSEEKEEKKEGVHKIERTFGSFSRSFKLNSEVQQDKIEAEYRDGILTLKIPKAEDVQEKALRIEVK
jgi:HSP20 family protein